jgi:hypothetical protein
MAETVIGEVDSKGFVSAADFSTSFSQTGVRGVPRRRARPGEAVSG